MTERHWRAPIWLMGLTYATFGLFGGFCVVTLPEVLAAQGVPGGRIAAMTAAIISPGFWTFMVSPMLDVRFSRRAYAIFFGVLTACALAFTVMHRTEPDRIEWVMMAGFFTVSLYSGAVGGWMGSLISKDQDGELGTWFAIGNTAAGGVMMFVGSEVLNGLRPALAAVVLGALVMLPMLIFPLLPAPGPDRRLVRESFGQFWRDVFALLKRREVLIALVLFLLPSASFALTNVLGGVGRDFSASERMVSICSGIGSVIAGVGGSLLVTPLAKRLPLRPLYLGIGIVGGLFTLSLLLLPHHPWTFALAVTGENVFQSMAFAASFAITFETIGPKNPLASTTYSVLLAASTASIIYMGFVDGWGYDHGGIRGSLGVDAGLSIVVCLALTLVLRGALLRSPRPDQGLATESAHS